MTQAGDAMKLASKEGISLKEAWKRVKAEGPASSEGGMDPDVALRAEKVLTKWTAKEEGF